MVHENGDLREVDDILRLLGNPGRFQVLQYMFLTYQYIPLAMNDLMPIFYGLQPVSVSCVGGTINAPTQTNTTLGANVTAFSATKVCGHCPDGSSYTFSYSGRQWSIVGDMNLICDRASLLSLTTVIFFLGQIVATPFFGFFSDRFGRRPTLLLSNLVYAVATLALVFSRDIVSFTLLRLLVGVAREGMNSSFFVLLMEWMPPDRRRAWAAMSELGYTVGVLALTLVAYLLQNWVYIQAFLAASSLIALPLYWFAPESLTWLCLHNKGDLVVANCVKVANFNGRTLSPDTQEKIRLFSGAPAATTGAAKTHSFIDCFRTPNIRKTTILCCLTWFSSYFGALGLYYLISDIADTIYLNVAINGALDFIPVILASGIAHRFGNKRPLIIYYLAAAVCCLVAGTIPGDTRAQMIGRNVVAFLGHMSFVGTTCVVFVFASELFPTVIRNNDFSLCSIALRIGCLLAPLLPLVGGKTSFKGAGFILLALSSMVSAGASALLRETKGKPLPDTIFDAEILGLAKPLRLPEGLRLRTLKSPKAPQYQPASAQLNTTAVSTLSTTPCFGR